MFITQLLNDDSEYQKSTKHRRLSFESYLKEKNIRNPTAAVDLAVVLRKFYAEARKKDGQMHSQKLKVKFIFSFKSSKIFWMNNKAIIEWGWVGYEEFCRSRRMLSTEAEVRGG